MIRRKKTTIFTDAKDTTTVLELKRMIEGEFQMHFLADFFFATYHRTFVLYLQVY